MITCKLNHKLYFHYNRLDKVCNKIGLSVGFLYSSLARGIFLLSSCSLAVAAENPQRWSPRKDVDYSSPRESKELDACSFERFCLGLFFAFIALDRSLVLASFRFTFCLALFISM